MTTTWHRYHVLGPALLATLLACGAEPPAPDDSAAPAGTDALPEAPPGAAWEGEAFTFHKIRDDVYHAVGTGNLTVGCNGGVIINETDVLLVDAHMTPAASWALLKELRNITDKPVRYVVNTHFHFDHAHGNQTYGPDVEIIGHRYTREQLVSGASKEGRAWESFVETIPDRIAALEQELEAAEGEEATAALERDLSIQRNYWDSTQSIVPTPPTMTLTHKMTLTRGGREIELLYLGRGHTGGDVVVYLPEEKIVATGDLLTNGIAYMGNGYLADWGDSLEKLKELEFDAVLPGHGEWFEDRAKIDHFQAYVRDLYERIVDKHRAGVDVEEAAKTIDMTDHQEHFPQIQGPGVHPHAVERTYGLLNRTEQ